MSMLMALKAPERTKRDTSELRMRSAPQTNSKSKHGILTTRTLIRQMENLQIFLVIKIKHTGQVFHLEKRNRCRCEESVKERLSRLYRSHVGSYKSRNSSNNRIEDRFRRIVECRIFMGRNPTWTDSNEVEKECSNPQPNTCARV